MDKVLLEGFDLIDFLKDKKTLLEKQEAIMYALLDLRNELVDSGLVSDTIVRGALGDAARTDQYWQKMKDTEKTST